MVHIYYHIYAIDGVEQIIDEQLYLIKTHFNFPYKLNIGISIANKNESISSILNILDVNLIRDIRAMGNEFVTLDLIEKDKETFGDSDYILYLHTKGASKINENYYKNLEDWRHLMNYWNIEKYNNVFKIFEKTDFNTCGINLHSLTYVDKIAYFGNFWWAKSEYLKTINLNNIRLSRISAEFEFIQNGENWKPYSLYDSNINHYYEPYSQENYRR